MSRITAFTPLAGDTYQRLHHFYAHQMRLLDNGAATEWAATFTEDGVFAQSNKPQARHGRHEIERRMRQNVGKLTQAGLTRRHWIGMLDAEVLEGGELRSWYYALVVETPHGGAPRLLLSTDCTDLLIPDGATWLVAHRLITHDDHVPSSVPVTPPAADPVH